MLDFPLPLLFCYFLWLFVGWSLFFVFIFRSVESSLSNQESILTCLISFWLIIKLSHSYYGCITLYYIILLSCIIADYFMLLCHYYLLLFLLFSFCFHLQSPISFTFIFQILLDLVLQLLFYLVFVLLYFIIIYPVYSLKPKMWGKDEQFHYFPSRHKWKHVLIFSDYFFWGRF